MTLSKKFVVWSGVLVALVLVVGTVPAWHLVGLSRGARAAAAEYEAADRAEAATAGVGWLRDVLRGAGGGAYASARYFDPVRAEVTEVISRVRLAAGTDVGDAGAELELAGRAEGHLAAAVREAGMGSAAGGAIRVNEAAAELDQVNQALREMAKVLPGAARRHVTAAVVGVREALVWTCVALAVALVLSLVVHFKQYRTLVRPLVWLRDEMRKSAAREYREPVRARGDAEFRDVAGYFNGLARDLAELYRGLEQKVIERSRELVRSERLASVGFLAAGVAHEINNPLSVISGYAELAGKGLRRVLTGDSGSAEADAEAEAEALSSALDAQEIIREEAFRCKEITGRLLSLARGGGDGRQALRLDEVARQVAVLTRGLKNYRDRRVVVEFEESELMRVVANLTEMKQVLLNLTVNALEAVPAEAGEVRIGGRRAGDWVEVFVEDNGKGMAPETLEHIFEPFFTQKRGAGEPGTGLGLSITHAIVENHGGRIRAESGGPGRGSRFTVRLPAGDRSVAAVPA